VAAISGRAPRERNQPVRITPILGCWSPRRNCGVGVILLVEVKWLVQQG
jgi:hypothetical protein